MPFAPSTELTDYLALLEPVDFGSDDDLVLPSPYLDESSNTVEIKAPRPSRSQIDSIQVRRLLRYAENDDPEGTLHLSPPDLEQCSTSGASSSGLITPISLDLEDVDVAISSISGSSYFGAIGTPYEPDKLKESSLFSSLLYVGQPLMPFDSLTESVFEPFDADDNTLPSPSFQAAHVGVDMVNKLLQADDDKEGSFSNFAHFPSPFDLVKEAILDNPSVTMAQQQPGPNNPTFCIDLMDADSTNILTKNAVDTSFSSSDACDYVNYDSFADASDIDQENEDEDLNPFVLEHAGIKYNVSGELGQGTYGQVVFARTSLGEEVAIKICGKARDGSTSAELRKAVLNERNVLVRISGEVEPFLTQPLACFQDADNVYFVLVSS